MTGSIINSNPHGVAPVDDVERNAASAVKIDDEDAEPNDEEYPAFARVVAIMLCLYLCVFIVALDRTIIGTAIPAITDDFKSLGDVGWYGSSYLLTASAFQLIYGRIYTFYSPKLIFLATIILFEIGSLLCALAPTSTAFIIGRAVAGLGSGGIFSGAIITMVATVPLHKRPLYQGLFGAVFGIASVAGPLLGGVFTTRITWRWCFWINLPIGGVAAFVMVAILKPPPTKNSQSLRQRIRSLDPLGSFVFLPGIVSIILALQWGGTTYAWSSWRIILLFTLGPILLIIFCIIQVKSGENATVPIRIIQQRSMIAGSYFMLVSPGAMFIMILFLPIWFQSIKGVSAVQSGINTLPMILALVVGSISSGVITGKLGYYTGQMYASSILLSVGSGLLTTLKVDSSSQHWIGYQVIFGLGLGLGLQSPNIAAQTVLAKRDVMTGISLLFFAQGLGGSIWLSIGQTIFNQSLVKNLKLISANIDPTMIVKTGATQLRHIVPPQYLPLVLVAYNKAITDTFKVAVGCAAATILGAIFMEWKSVKAAKEAADKAALEKKQAAEAVEAATADSGTDETKVASNTTSEKM